MAKVFKAYGLNAVTIDFSNCLSTVKLGLLRLPLRGILAMTLLFIRLLILLGAVANWKRREVKSVS